MNITDQSSHYTYLDIQSTVRGEEILSNHLRNLQPNWTKPTCRKMQIDVDKNCLLKINGEDEVLIKPSLGICIEYADKDIESIMTLTEGVNLYAIIAY